MHLRKKMNFIIYIKSIKYKSMYNVLGTILHVICNNTLYLLYLKLLRN
jgi:hypothetical protein